MPTMDIQGPEHVYTVTHRVGECSHYRLYTCLQQDTDRQCIMMIAAERRNNADLERAAYLLKQLRKEGDLNEEDYAKDPKNEGRMLNYQLGFPEVMDSFIFEEQDHRRILILAFDNIQEIDGLVPLLNIREKDLKRLDIKTGAWILGKALKTLKLAHSIGISMGTMDASRILVQLDEHYVIMFDWCYARTGTDQVPRDLARRDIMNVARAVITALGGDWRSRHLPFPGNEEGYGRFTEILFRLAGGAQTSAAMAHQTFYEMVDAAWEPGFHPATTHPLEKTGD